MLLKKEGIEVTQSTLSRDIRELGLLKARGRYQMPGQAAGSPPGVNLRRAFQQYVMDTGLSDNMLMIRTSAGNAHSVCVALDEAQWSEVLGTIAGEDTIFVLLRHPRMGSSILDRIRELTS
jgi:transcriptional regulator of arginine metabolism